MQLVRVTRRLKQLESLATADKLQELVWELNDFISSARKVTIYLRSESGRPTGFRQWVDRESNVL